MEAKLSSQMEIDGYLQIIEKWTAWIRQTPYLSQKLAGNLVLTTELKT